MSLARVEDQQLGGEQWEARELAFFQNTRRTVLHIISEKLTMPRLFEVRDELLGCMCTCSNYSGIYSTYIVLGVKDCQISLTMR